MHPQPCPFTLQLFLDFWAIFSPDGPSIFWVHDSPGNLAKSQYPLYFPPNRRRSEGTRTWQDYLVNRDDQKNKGHSGKKIAEKSRNNCRVNGRGCGCTWTVDSRRDVAQFYNQIQTLKECLFCHIYCAQLCAHLRAIVTFSCASLIGSPGTLLGSFIFSRTGTQCSDSHVQADAWEGTGTQPDYLVNRADQKKWGAIWGQKLNRNREIVVQWMVDVVGV